MATQTENSNRIRTSFSFVVAVREATPVGSGGRTGSARIPQEGVR
jgi:hypothetical protein